MNKNIKDDIYNKHKKNQLRLYFKNNWSNQFGRINNSLVRIENQLGHPLEIKDLKEKNFKWIGRKNIGKKCNQILEFYSNWENLLLLIANRPDLETKDFPINEKDEEIEKIIIQDISSMISNFNAREKFIFISHFGYKTKVLTLEKTSEELVKLDSKTKLSRERIRQILSKIKRKISSLRTLDRNALIKFLVSKQDLGFHKLFPILDKNFSDTVSTGAVDVKGDRLLTFIECYCKVSENFFQTPEKILKTEFDPSQLKEIFFETPSPIDYENFITQVMEVFGYKEQISKVAINFMEEKKIIKIIDNKIYPIKLTKIEEAAHIALKFPNGIFWKDIYEIMNTSNTQNKYVFSKRAMGDHVINSNPYLWLCGKGTWKHVNFLYCKDNSDSILKKVLEIFKNKNCPSLKVIEIFNSFKKNTIMSDNELDYYELRTIIRNYGQKFGLHFIGRSGVDSVSVRKDSQYISGKENIFRIIKRNKTPILEKDIEMMLSGKTVESKGVVSVWADQLLKEKKIMRVGPKQWCELNESIKMCNLNLLIDNLLKLFNFFDIVSVHYFTKYINEKMDLSLSYYYYDSIFKIYSKKINLFYYNNFLSKKNDKLTIKLIYNKYFDKKSNLKENITNLNKKYKIAVSKDQFINVTYMF
tara:strand:+ start:2884 stop:4809 length:1926 start_codon:yes stop_codon:yes gene_type:complete